MNNGSIEKVMEGCRDLKAFWERQTRKKKKKTKKIKKTKKKKKTKNCLA